MRIFSMYRKMYRYRANGTKKKLPCLTLTSTTRSFQ